MLFYVTGQYLGIALHSHANTIANTEHINTIIKSHSGNRSFRSSTDLVHGLSFNKSLVIVHYYQNAVNSQYIMMLR